MSKHSRDTAVSVGAICDDCLAWAHERDYAGYDPYDGLNSPVLNPLTNDWLTRLIGMHAVNKSPVNLRPLLRIPAERNPKGIALFAMAYLNRYRETGDTTKRDRAETLLRWLENNRSSEYDLAAWGYNFDWQNARKFFLPAYQPSIVVTVFGGRAFLEYYETTGEPWALEIAESAATFIQENINREQVNGFDVFTYTPHDSFVLVNTNALAAGFFYQLASHTSSTEFSERATELFRFVVDSQADSGGWYYAIPANESHLSHDNFHTGFVLESLYGYAMDQPADHPARKAYNKGLQFYRDNLFDKNGAPRFEADKRYPYDAHAAAQAILTFTQRDTNQDRKMAKTVCEWATTNMLNDDGYFHRRIGRVLTDKTPYMRWSQAWMCRALSALSLRDSENG
ncbi:hypothetical protein DJ83_10405 [Halorubrum ezzemoulense]|uniref:Antibiotic ABC transporter permease n=1 Tax=Halorubrum ezzemoulense TaxID=337243 RepID=A0A256IV01_HALEZ|nr:hypothetical protein [Halorubrum ezzemoulense]OYR60106.1 hypothetical protein DJ83_10405 [Halorubrum ezzemoulense]